MQDEISSYNEVVQMAIETVAQSIEETAYRTWTTYTTGDECIVLFGERTQVNKTISLSCNGTLLGRYNTVDGALRDMTNSNGKYKLYLESQEEAMLGGMNFYLPADCSTLPKVSEIIIEGKKVEAGNGMYFVPMLQWDSDLTVSCPLTIESIYLDNNRAEICLDHTVLTLKQYSCIESDIYAVNSKILTEKGSVSCELIGDLYGSCDVSIGARLDIRGSAEIDLLTAQTDADLHFSSTLDSADTIKKHTINKVVSESVGPVSCGGNNHDISIGELELTGINLLNISYHQLADKEQLPVIRIEKLIGSPEILIYYGLSTTYVSADTSGNEVENWTETTGLDVFKNNGGLCLVCPGIDLSRVNASYFSDGGDGSLIVSQIGNNLYVDIPGEENHVWSDKVVTEAPTCMKPGTSLYTCSTCGMVRVVEMPRKSHTIVNGSCVVCGTIGFSDVPANAYYYDAVKWAVEQEITNGYGSDTVFCPDVSCTRGQIVTFLWRALGCPEPASLNNPFTDVASGDYYYKAVLWAVEKGITQGYGSDTIFNPNGECTRGQVATFMWRAEGMPSVNTMTNRFTDVSSDSYYHQAVLWAVENEITNGYGSDTIFYPDGICNRGQIVTFLYRGMN